MTRFELRQDEVESIQRLLADLASRFASSEDPAFHAEARLDAQELPRRLREALRRFKLEEPQSALFIVSGYPVDQEKIGPTPGHWKRADGGSPAVEVEMLLVLLGTLVGECIGWSTQQDGRIVHDIVPIEAHKEEQLGSGSEQTLEWHTEDAFHPYRGDYLGMACLRNPDGVPTTFANLVGLDLDPEHKRLLFEPHFTIRPDNSHQVQHKAEDREVDEALGHSYEEIERMTARPEKIAVLFGSPESPYMRLDPYFMDPVEGEAKVQEALDAFIQAIDRRLEDVVLQPGDFCFIDNFQGVHGRKPFRARFDGTDRWMKRINVARDLRKSRSARQEAAARVLV